MTAVLLMLMSLVVDVYIFFDIRSFAARARRHLYCWIYGVSCVLCWALAIVALNMPIRSPEASILPVMWMLFTYLSIYIPKFIYALISIVGRIVNAIRRKRSRGGAVTGAVVAVLTFCVMWWGVIFTRRDIEVNNVELYSDKLPASFDGFRVTQFSDAHVGTWGNDTTFISQLVDSLNAQEADVIVFTGDIVNRQSSELDPFIPVLKRLHAPHGVYAIFGNHDYAGYVDWPGGGDANEDVAKLAAKIEGMGWKLLANKTDFIRSGNDSIVMIGVENWGEPPFNTLGDLGKSYPDSLGKHRGLNDDMYKILLTHNPQHWKMVATDISNIDLSLSGHTHAMQMMLEAGDWKWSPSVYRYPEWGGLYKATAKDGNPMNLYVNIGVGEVGFPARIGAARPEITNIVLHTKK